MYTYTFRYCFSTWPWKASLELESSFNLELDYFDSKSWDLNLIWNHKSWTLELTLIQLEPLYLWLTTLGIEINYVNSVTYTWTWTKNEMTWLRFDWASSVTHILTTTQCTSPFFDRFKLTRNSHNNLENWNVPKCPQPKGLRQTERCLCEKNKK